MSDEIDIDDLDDELDQLFDPKEEITRVVNSCDNFRLELLITIILDCGLSIAVNNEIAISAEDKFKLIKAEISDRNGKETPTSYTMRVLGLTGGCYASWKNKDKVTLSQRCYKLLTGLKEYDSYWLDRVLNYMEHVDVN